MSVSLTNVSINAGNYRFTESGARFEYWPSSGDLYRLNYVHGEWTYIYVRTVHGEANRQQLTDALSSQVGIPNSGPEYGPQGSLVGQPVGGLPGTPSIGSPKYVPNSDDPTLGAVPQTVQSRVAGIGVVPGISPVRFDKSYRPKEVDMKVVPTTAEGFWEFIRNVVSEQIKQTPVHSPFMGEVWARRRN